MKIVLFGATGKTGGHILKHALVQGHHVRAYVRSSEQLNVSNANLEVMNGDVLDAASVRKAVEGMDAVIAVLGAGVKKSTLRTVGNRNIVRAMQETGVRRLISQSVFGVGDSYKQLPLYWKIFVKPLVLRHAYKDHAGQEAIIESSNLDWTIIRPVSLRETPATGKYQSGEPNQMGKITLKIGLDDLAEFTLSQLNDPFYIRKKPGISY